MADAPTHDLVHADDSPQLPAPQMPPVGKRGWPLISALLATIRNLFRPQNTEPLPWKSDRKRAERYRATFALIHHEDGDEHGDQTGSTDAATAAYTRLDFDHVEYEDTTHIPAHSSLLMHVELADPNGDGGAAGRWMKHCHIFQHGENGMMTELIISP